MVLFYGICSVQLIIHYFAIMIVLHIWLNISVACLVLLVISCVSPLSPLCVDIYKEPVCPRVELIFKIIIILLIIFLGFSKSKPC